MANQQSNSSTWVDPRVDCPWCLVRADEILSQGNSLMSGGRASYEDVGNVARPEFGHVMCYTPTGRLALCRASRKHS